MEYIHPPIYKYILLFTTIFLLFKHQSLMATELIFIDVLIIVMFIYIFDMILIKNQTNLFSNAINNESIVTQLSKNEDSKDEDVDDIEIE